MDGTDSGNAISHRERRYRDALPNVGRRCRWNDAEVAGTIVDVVKVRGGSRYIVDWDDDTPPWWGNAISTAHGPTFVIEACHDVVEMEEDGTACAAQAEGGVTE